MAVIPDIELVKKLERTIKKNPASVSGPSYHSMNKVLADMYLLMKEDLKGIYHLTEAHAATLRQQTIIKYDYKEDLIKNPPQNKATGTSNTKSLPIVHGIHKKFVEFDSEFALQEENGLLSRLRDMPKEWTVVQLTRQSENRDVFRTKDTVLKPNNLFITRLACGAALEECPPITVLIGPPKSNEGMPTLIDLVKKATHDCLRTKNTNPKEIRKARDLASELIQEAVKELSDGWLKEWKCLLLGSLCSSQYKEQAEACINNVLKHHYNITVNSRNQELLFCIASGAVHLTSAEIKSAVSCVVTCIDLYTDLVRAIEAFKEELSGLMVARRHPVILIVDEALDLLPWESLPILKRQPVSRIPSIHFLHALYHEHKDYIKDGCRVVSALDVGFYIVNPDQDLQEMEKRLVSFLQTRMPEWKGLKGVRPSTVEFGDALINNNIFVYCGHFNGTHFISQEDISSLRVVALPLLFGCSSVALQDLGGQAQATGVSDKYIMAGSACVLGMLWTVTSDDTDCMTAMLLNSWLPGKPVDITAFRCSGDMLSVNKEPELLRLMRHARDTAHMYSNGAAIVARGLPIKIEKKDLAE